MTHNFPLKPSPPGDDKVALVVAESKSFVAFDEWMDAQLASLIAQWAHTAAPNARRAEGNQRRFAR